MGSNPIETADWVIGRVTQAWDCKPHHIGLNPISPSEYENKYTKKNFLLSFFCSTFITYQKTLIFDILENKYLDVVLIRAKLSVWDQGLPVRIWSFRQWFGAIRLQGNGTNSPLAQRESTWLTSKRL
jgi:hypothetical protein